jgi:tripartite-type tricarboxylate transporter receptor subunit TctC
LPTIAAAGNMPGYESAATAGVFAPAGTPERIINQLNDEVRRVLNRPEVKERFFNQGIEVVTSSPGETAAFVKSDTATIAKLIRDARIPAER